MTDERTRAQCAVSGAILVGKLVRPDTCELKVGCSGPIQAAHYDYDRANWLKVRWLCVRHHKLWDNSRRQEPIHRNPASQEKIEAVTVRFPASLRQRALGVAQDEDRTFASLVIYALRRYVEHAERTEE